MPAVIGSSFSWASRRKPEGSSSTLSISAMLSVPLGGTIAGGFWSNRGSIGLLEMGFLWGGVTVGENIGSS